MVLQPTICHLLWRGLRSDGRIQKQDPSVPAGTADILQAGSLSCRRQLCLDLGLHLSVGNGPEIVVVHTYVVLEREQVLETGMIEPRMRHRPAVYVAEQLPHIPIRAAIGEEGVMVQDDALSAYADGHLLGHELEAAHESLLDVLHVVVAQNQVDLAVQAVHDVVPVLRSAKAEVTQMEHDTIVRYGLVPATDDFLVHHHSIGKWPAAEANDVLVVEMRVCREPDLVGFKLVCDFYWSHNQEC